MSCSGKETGPQGLGGREEEEGRRTKDLHWEDTWGHQGPAFEELLGHHPPYAVQPVPEDCCRREGGMCLPSWGATAGTTGFRDRAWLRDVRDVWSWSQKVPGIQA